MKSAGVLGHVEIANGKQRITVHVSKGVGMIEASSGWLSMREACTYGKLGRSRAYELIGDGVLKTKKSGNRTLVSKTSIDRWLRKLPRSKR